MWRWAFSYRVCNDQSEAGGASRPRRLRRLPCKKNGLHFSNRYLLNSVPETSFNLQWGLTSLTMHPQGMHSDDGPAHSLAPNQGPASLTIPMARTASQAYHTIYPIQAGARGSKPQGPIYCF